MVPVSWPVQKPHTRPRRSLSRCCWNTRASSMMQALPAALSVACGPGQESWWPPTTTKSSVRPCTSPTVICTGRQPFSTLARNHTRTGPALQHLAQLQAGGAGDADAGQRRHLGLVGLGRRIAPHRLHRAERHGRILRMPPVHHHAAGRAHDGGDALLLVARGMIGQLRERDLAGGVAPLVLAEGAGGDVDQLGRDAIGQRRQAVAQRVGLDRQLHRRQHPHLGLLGEAHQPRHLVHARGNAGLGQRLRAVFRHALAVGGAGKAGRDLRGDVLDMGLDVGRRHRVDDRFIRHAHPRHSPYRCRPARKMPRSSVGGGGVSCGEASCGKLRALSPVADRR